MAGVSVRRVEDITEALWGSKVSPSTISEAEQESICPYRGLAGTDHCGAASIRTFMSMVSICAATWGGEYENVAILVAIAVNEDGYREVIGAAEGMKEDKISWMSFFSMAQGTRTQRHVQLVIWG